MPVKTLKRDELQELLDRALDIQEFRVRVVGTSPLMTHAWSAKAKGIIEDGDKTPKDSKRPPRDPEAEYESCFYRLPDGSAGIPARAFKQAIVTAVGQVDGLTKTFTRTSFHVIGDAVGDVLGMPTGEARKTDLIRIEGCEPTMRTDMVRVGPYKVADVRYRPEWSEWSCWVTIRHNAKAISVQQIVSLLRLAGFGVGIFEWRPEKGGMHGMFEVVEIEVQEETHA